MTLGIFLAMGDSFKNMARSSQDILFKKFYLSYFAKNFSQIYVFSYARENVKDLPKNVQVIPNKYNLHRYLYSFLMPFLNLTLVSKCDVIRVYHLFGTIPAIITRFFFGKSYIFNYAYDYQKIAKIEARWLNYFLLKILKPIALFSASKIFVANKQLMKKVDAQKSFFLPNGTDTNFFKPRKTKANKRLLVLSVGRLEKQKNFESLIEAMVDIKADLLIVGNGSLKSKLLKLAIKNRVNLKIIEKVENTQMPRIYNKADIFALPSLVEGSPKALMEAMACGITCIGNDVEGIRGLIVDMENGFLTRTGTGDFRKRLQKLIRKDSMRRKIGQNARTYIVNNFNSQVLLEKEVKVMKK